MFKELGSIASLLKQAPRIKEEMGKFQERLGEITTEGDAGAGMVKVRVNGKLEVQRITIAEETINANDRELLEDLLKSAANQALDKARKLVAEETSKIAGNLGISGMPDLSSMLGNSG